MRGVSYLQQSTIFLELHRFNNKSVKENGISTSVGRDKPALGRFISPCSSKSSLFGQHLCVYYVFLHGPFR